jgi:hypothetical protein
MSARGTEEGDERARRRGLSEETTSEDALSGTETVLPRTIR